MLAGIKPNRSGVLSGPRGPDDRKVVLVLAARFRASTEESLSQRCSHSPRRQPSARVGVWVGRRIAQERDPRYSHQDSDLIALAPHLAARATPAASPTLVTERHGGVQRMCAGTEGRERIRCAMRGSGGVRGSGMRQDGRASCTSDNSRLASMSHPTQRRDANVDAGEGGAVLEGLSLALVGCVIGWGGRDSEDRRQSVHDGEITSKP
ncbi:hypothetical protein C8R47DRAFT_1080017 [Mycena vitilis]|nr:hypothetical protein C8R47DRAFT_1080017 [Mycena vitilis]